MKTWRPVAGGACLCIGHRGAAGLEPQNTLRAFQRALDLGVDAVEFDVRRTADGQFVVVHSEELAESTNGRGLVGERSLADIRQLDAGDGERVPTLDETLDLLKGKALLVVDIKLPGTEAAVLSALAAHGAVDDALLCCLVPETLRHVRALDADVMTAISYPEDRGNASTKPYLAGAVRAAVAAMRALLPWRIAAMMGRAQANATMLYHKLITPAVVEAVHRQSGFIGAWTVDDEAGITRMRSLGVDSITSNRPDLVLQATGQTPRGLASPSAQ